MAVSRTVILAGIAVVVILGVAPPHAHAQKKKSRPDTGPPTREALQKDVRPDPLFTATIFASPPDVSYPTCLCAAPDGSLFVGVDLAGSLGTKKGMGKVVRCFDVDNDGVADKFQTFCEVDHPRGLFFHRNKLIVLNPPFLTAFFDDNGDGVADRSEVLVKGISTDVTFTRGGDHTTNGFRLGIDGWLYIAVGDFGFLKAEGKDGKTVQLYGGGVVRVRPDGTELEVASTGQRNIYDVAVSPLLDLFTRDNTNDGGGWDVRLSHVVPLGDYGYPRRFLHFADEILQPLADYGGGAPCGSLFLSEPGFPEGYGNTLYTADWGRGAVYRHPLKPKGASYADKLEQKPLVNLPSPTDVDVDGSGRIYVSSWKGGGFNFSNPNVGFVARLTPKDWKYRPFADPEKMSDAELALSLASPSHYQRQYTQLEILRRGPKTDIVMGVDSLLAVDQPVAVRVAALFTYKQLLGEQSLARIRPLGQSAELREFAMRAAADRLGEATAVPTSWLRSFLGDADPRVRLEAVTALGRLRRTEAAAAMLPLTSDLDPVVRHVAGQALVLLKPVDACLAALDAGKHVVGCLRVLQIIHEPRVSDALIARYTKATTAEQQQTLLPALCRLYYREATWDGKWWGTRPDTTGPYFRRVTWSESEKIGKVLQKALGEVDSPTQRLLLVELRKHRIDVPGADRALLKFAASDPSFRAQAIELFSSGSTAPAETLDLFRQTALSSDSTKVRAKALRSLHRYMGQKGFLDAALDAFAALSSDDLKRKELASAWEDFTRDTKHGQHVDAIARLVDDADRGRRDLALAVLVNVASGKLTESRARSAAQTRIDRLWTDKDRVVPLIEAIAQTRTDEYAFQLKGLLGDSRPDVRQAAERAWKTLGLDRLTAKDRVVLKGQPYEQVFEAVLKEPGDPKFGATLFLRQGCIACHTILPSEPLKGPYLGDIAVRYKRPDLAESILKPSAKIAQGFETIFFVLSDGKVTEGFIVRESGEETEIRTNAGVVQVLKKADVEERGRRNISVMPEGIVDNLTVSELASLLAYLESLDTKKE